MKSQNDKTNSEHRIILLLRKTKKIQEELEVLKIRIEKVKAIEKLGEPLIITVNKARYPGDPHETRIIPEREELKSQKEDLEIQLGLLDTEIKELKKGTKISDLTVNIKNNIENSAVNLGIMKDNSKIENHQNFSNKEIGEIKDVIGQLKQNLPKIKLEAREMKIIIKETSQLENELKKDNPEKQIIKRKFGAVKKILEGVSDNVITKGVIILISKILKRFFE